MTAKNDVTNDEIKSGVNTEQYRNNWDNIFSEQKRNFDIVMEVEEDKNEETDNGDENE